MIKRLQKNIKKYHTAEEGSALIISLGVVILLFVVIVGIFYFALDTKKNIDLSDRFTKLKDAKAYAFEESKVRLTTYFEKEIRQAIGEVSNAANNALVKSDIERRILSISTINSSGEIVKPFLSSVKFGVNKQYQFKVGISDMVGVSSIAAYGSNVTGGWTSTPVAGQEAKQIKIPIAIELEETKGNQKIVHYASSDFIYEIQWETKVHTSTPAIAKGTEFGQVDTWRNIFYNHYTNGENGLISADAWTRLLYRGYQYQAKKQVTFNETAYASAVGTYVFGKSSNQGVVDTKLTDSATSVTNSVTKHLAGRGSIIIKDAGLSSATHRTVSSDNMLVIINDSKLVDTNFTNLKMTATTGMFLSKFNQQTTIKDSEITTPAWLVTQTQKKNNVKDTALLLDNTTVSLGNVQNKFDYTSYLKTSTLANPQLDPQWKNMLTGGLVIGSSVVELTNGSNITLGSGSPFMLTNATIEKSDNGEDSFSYQTEHTGGWFSGLIKVAVPNPPSTLKIGTGTSIVQEPSEISYIDAPKKNRRLSSAENVAQPQDEWLDASIARNMIEIETGGKLALGTTGIEPFTLKLAKNAEFSFHITSETALFDTTFIKEGDIKGKLIIYTWDDSTDISNYLRSNGVACKVKRNPSDAENGEVTVIEKFSASVTGGLNIVRTFNYLVDVDFKNKK